MIIFIERREGGKAEGDSVWLSENVLFSEQIYTWSLKAEQVMIIALWVSSMKNPQKKKHKGNILFKSLHKATWSLHNFFMTVVVNYEHF